MRIVQCLIGVICIFTLVACGSSGDDGEDIVTELNGIWKGTYTCTQGLTGLTLTLTGKSGGVVEGVFNFYEVETNPGVPNGSFNMIGAYSSTRKLTLNADESDWIEQPSGWRTVDLDGTVSANLSTYSGTVSSNTGASSCTSFSLTKE